MTVEEFVASVAAAIGRVKLDAVVVGNIAAALHHAPVVTHDIDLLVRTTPLNERKLSKLASELGGSQPAPISDLTNGVRIHGLFMPIDVLFDRIAGGLTFAAVKSRASRIEGLNVASLADVIRSKEAAGRPKDQAVLHILRETLETNEKL